jgi:hypothetical protein
LGTTTDIAIGEGTADKERIVNGKRLRSRKADKAVLREEYVMINSPALEIKA